MKQTILLSTFGILVFCACTNKDESNTKGNGSKVHSRTRMTSSGPYSQFIPMDTANRMIKSYLTSIDYPANDSDLNSIIFSTDSLRAYLKDTSIKNIKIMFAHSLRYINSGGEGQNCGYQSGELTVIIAGYDSTGNYIFYPQNTVLEMGIPCPSNCPANGTAANPLLSN